MAPTLFAPCSLLPRGAPRYLPGLYRESISQGVIQCQWRLDLAGDTGGDLSTALQVATFVALILHRLSQRFVRQTSRVDASHAVTSEAIARATRAGRCSEPDEQAMNPTLVVLVLADAGAEIYGRCHRAPLLPVAVAPPIQVPVGQAEQSTGDATLPISGHYSKPSDRYSPIQVQKHWASPFLWAEPLTGEATLLRPVGIQDTSFLVPY